jgi:two-component system, response regulator / RNA-binding antiterminator
LEEPTAPIAIVGGWHVDCTHAVMLDDSLPLFQMRILIAGQHPARVLLLEEGLRDAGYSKIVTLLDFKNLMRRIVDLDSDVLLIDLQTPSRDLLKQMFDVSRSVRRPIALFVDRSDTDAIAAAVNAGVSEYVVDGLRRERAQTALHLAVSRFKVYDALREELECAKAALDERKWVERAKGILMSKRGLSEEAAYVLLRKAAMNGNRRIGEVAQRLVAAAALSE